MKVEIGCHWLGKVGIGGHFVVVAEVVEYLVEEEGEVEGYQREEEEEEVEEVGYLVWVGEFVGVGG